MARKMLIQHNSLITARYEMSAAEKNITYMLLSQIEENDPIDKVYYISINEMEALTGRKLNHKQLDASTDKLLSRVYHIPEVEGLLKVCMMSSTRYVKGSGRIAIRIDPEIRPYLFKLKSNFTQIGFYVVMTLKSKYAKRIYEMLSQFRGKKAMYISVEELRTRLGLTDKYLSWTNFVEKVLSVAEQELKEHSDLYFTYTAKKEGRRFTHLTLHIRKASKLPACIPSALKEGKHEPSRAYERLMSRFGLSGWQAKLIVEGVAEKEIAKTLHEIDLRIVNSELTNIGGFTVKTFENKYQLGLLGGKASAA